MHKDQIPHAQNQLAKNLEAGFTELAHVLAEVLVDQESHASTMVPKEAQKAKYVATLEKEFVTLKRRLENGEKSLQTALEHIAKAHPEIHLQDVKNDLNKLISLLENIAHLLQGEELHHSLQEAIGMSDASLEALYKAAKYLYEHQQYQEAADCFGVLTMLHPKHALFWIGFGNSEYFCNHFEAALIAYAMAVQADPDEVSPHLYSARCYEQLHQYDNAVNALDIALFVIQDDKESHALKEQIKGEKVRLQHKINT